MEYQRIGELENWSRERQVAATVPKRPNLECPGLVQELISSNQGTQSPLLSHFPQLPESGIEFERF
jgi:hypothetical protein